MYDLSLLCDGLIAAVDWLCSTLDELALDSTGLHGMPIYCNKHTVQSEHSFSIVYNNSNGLLLFVSPTLSQLRLTTLQCCSVQDADVY